VVGWNENKILAIFSQSRRRPSRGLHCVIDPDLNSCTPLIEDTHRVQKSGMHFIRLAARLSSTAAAAHILMSPVADDAGL